MRNRAFKNFPGQGLVEYSLIGSLGLTAIVAGLLFMSNRMGDVLDGFNGSLTYNKKEHAAKLALIATTVPKPSGNGSSQAALVNGNLTALSSAQLSQTIATAGANGTTAMLADAIKAAARQQLIDKTITQSQYNNLIALANKGYYLGALQGGVESAAESLTRGDNIKDITVNVNGERKSVYDIWGEIGYSNEPNEIPTDISNPLVERPRSALAGFLDTYDTVQKSGALNNPVFNEQISVLSSQIVQINSAMDKLLWNSSSILSATDLNSKMVSTITNKNSAQICEMGNGANSNSNCKG